MIKVSVVIVVVMPLDCCQVFYPNEVNKIIAFLVIWW